MVPVLLLCVSASVGEGSSTISLFIKTAQPALSPPCSLPSTHQRPTTRLPFAVAYSQPNSSDAVSSVMEVWTHAGLRERGIASKTVNGGPQVWLGSTNEAVRYEAQLRGNGQVILRRGSFLLHQLSAQISMLQMRIAIIPFSLW
jgi:hypothetical protein